MGAGIEWCACGVLAASRPRDQRQVVGAAHPRRPSGPPDFACLRPCAARAPNHARRPPSLALHPPPPTTPSITTITTITTLPARPRAVNSIARPPPTSRRLVRAACSQLSPDTALCALTLPCPAILLVYYTYLLSPARPGHLGCVSVSDPGANGTRPGG